MQCVQAAWGSSVPLNKNPFETLHIKLNRTAKALRVWSKTIVPQGKLALAICREVIHQLEKAQEARMLDSAELSLIKLLKVRILGLAAIEKCRARQKSKLSWLRKGMPTQSFFT
jgi:hypothetical protein